MHEDPTQTMTTLGKPGETCEECGGPLAVDQRYCLNCGHRRGEARVDYRGVMAASNGSPGQGQAPPPSAPVSGGPSGEKQPPEEGKKGERDFAPLAAVGGIAVLGLMLLVGVLIGRGDSSPTATSAPQVVRVPAAGAAETSGGAGGAEAGGDGKGKANAGGGSGGKSEATSKGLSGGGKGDESVHEVSSGELEELESESGEAAAEKALDLPNKIATPGAPPPIDKSKPPGGGEGGGLVIK